MTGKHHKLTDINMKRAENYYRVISLEFVKLCDILNYATKFSQFLQECHKVA